MLKKFLGKRLTYPSQWILMAVIAAVAIGIAIPLFSFAAKVVGAVGGYKLLIAIGIIMSIVLLVRRLRRKKYGAAKVGFGPAYVALMVLAALMLSGYISRWYVERYRTHRAAEVEAMKAERVELARSLRSGIAIEAETTFVVTATATPGKPFVVGHELCLSTHEVRGTEAYELVDQNGRHIVMPGEVEPLPHSEYFWLLSYGGPRTDVRISTYKRHPSAGCLPPKRVKRLGVSFYCPWM